MRLTISGGILCAGNIVYDILVRPVDELPWGGTAWVESIDPHLGGNGANTSFAIAKLGVPARLLGIVGEDDFGEYCIRRLKCAGVNVSRVERSGERTASTVGLIKSDGARTFLHRPGASRLALRRQSNSTAS